MDLKPEVPAHGILIHNDWGDAKQYEIPCSCGDSNHSHRVWIEADETGVSVTTWTQQKTNWWSKKRWHHLWTLLTKGYIEVEGDTIMNAQQALNYAKCLEQAVKDVGEFRNRKK